VVVACEVCFRMDCVKIPGVDSSELDSDIDIAILNREVFVNNKESL